MTLLFSIEARQHFDPVAQQFGLICVTSNDQGLRYENEKVFLEVNFDNGRSYALGIEIGKQHTQYLGPPFSLAEILRLCGIQDAAFVSKLMVSNELQLPGILSRLAQLTLDYASDFLMGNDLSFARIEKLRNKESAEFELASQLRYARSIIDIAWPARDYKAIVKALELLEPYLSPSEKKRLEFARKQLSHS